MSVARFTQVLHLLAAALMAIWPAATASACCCAGLAAADEGGCQQGCCAPPGPDCCAAETADGLHCCPSADERDTCGCWHDCGNGAVHRAVRGTPIDSWRSFGHAMPSDTWSDLRPGLALEKNLLASATSIPARSVRVLYGVWRN